MTRVFLVGVHLYRETRRRTDWFPALREINSDLEAARREASHLDKQQRAYDRSNAERENRYALDRKRRTAASIQVCQRRLVDASQRQVGAQATDR